MLFSKSTQIFPQSRLAWMKTAGTFLAVAICSFLILSIFDKPSQLAETHASPGGSLTHNGSRSTSVEVKAPASASTADDQSFQSNQDATVGKDLIQKLDVDTRHVQELEKQRKYLLSSKTATSSSAEAPDFSPEHKTRKDLVAELILLLKLEKEDKTESSEIVAVRHKITRLQTELSQGDAAAPASSEPDTQSDPVQLGKLRSQISQGQADVLADQQKLAAYLEAARQSKASQQLKDVHAGNSAVTPPSVATKMSLPIETSAPRFPLRLLVMVSVLIGVLASVGLMLWMSRTKDSITNEVKLQRALAGRANFIGSIPRMKAQ
jgi:hypothetical protein